MKKILPCQNAKRKMILFFSMPLFSLFAFTQTTIVNYDFNSGTSYATLAPQLASGITSSASSTESWQTYTGTATGASSFTTNSTAGNALGMSNSSGINTRYFQFQLGGTSLSSYTTFKIYLQ